MELLIARLKVLCQKLMNFGQGEVWLVYIKHEVLQLNEYYLFSVKKHQDFRSMDVVYFSGNCGVIPKISMKYIGNLKSAVVQAGEVLGNFVLARDINLFNKNTFTSYFLITFLDF